LLTQVWRFNGRNGVTDGTFYCSSGNGTHRLPNPGCADDLAGDGTTFVGHAGDAYGLKSGLCIDRQRGVGVAYFNTAVPDPAPKAAGSAYTAAEVAAFRPTASLIHRRESR
jgi:hypothetical protein